MKVKLLLIFIAVTSFVYAQNYVLEFQSPNGTTFPRYGFMPYNCDLQHYFYTLDNIDMDGDSIPEIFIDDCEPFNALILIYSGATHELKWSFESWLDEYGCNPALLGFFHMDDDDIKEAVKAYATDGDIGVIEVIDWNTDNVEFTLSNVQFDEEAGKPKAFVIDIDNDNIYEIIAQVGDNWSNEHIEIWGYGTTEIDNPGIKPSQLKLNQNFPNPFNPTTTIKYELKKSGFVELKVYNIKGQLIDTLVKKQQDLGNHSIVFDAKRFSSGQYFYQISIDGQVTDTKKAIYLK